MRTPHLLLLSSIALSSPALAAELKSTAKANGKPGVESNLRTDAARSNAANDEMIPIRTARKSRVRHTFPPPAKHP